MSADIATADGGEQEWVFQAGNQLVGSPTVVGDTVYVASSDWNVYAVDATSGREAWAFQPAGGAASVPAVVDGTVYVSSFGHTLYAIDSTSGQEEWTFQAVGSGKRDPRVGDITYADGTVYIGSYNQALYAVDATSGQEEWTFQFAEGVGGWPTIVDETVYVGSRDGNLYAVDAVTGEQQWAFQTDGRIWSSPTVADGTVYVGSSDNNLYAVDVTSGRQQWTFQTGDNVASSPTVADDTVYVGSYDDNLYAVNATSGRQQWAFQTGTGINSSPTVADDTVYIGSYDHNLYAVNATSGRQQWAFQTGDNVDSSPTVADGTVYVGSYDGNLYAVDAGVEGSSDGSRVLLGTIGHHDETYRDADLGGDSGDRQANSPPTADFVMRPDSPTVGDELTLDASSSVDPDGQIESYEWRLGEDSKFVRRGEQFAVEVPEAGEATITLRVTDDAGATDTAIQTVTVTNTLPDEYHRSREATLEVAEDIRDISVTNIPEPQRVEPLLTSYEEAFEDGAFASPDAPINVTDTLRFGESISRELLVQTSARDDNDSDVLEESRLAVQTTEYTIQTAVSLAMVKLSLEKVIGRTNLGAHISERSLKLIGTALEDFVAYVFTEAVQSEAIGEIVSTAARAVDNALAGQFDTASEFTAFVEDNIATTVSNLTLQQSIESGAFDPLVPSTDYSPLLLQFTGVEDSLAYLHEQFAVENVTPDGLDGTVEQRLDLFRTATDSIDALSDNVGEVLESFDVVLSEVNLLFNTYDLLTGLKEGNLRVWDLLGLLGSLIPGAGLVVAGFRAAGQMLGRQAIQAMLAINHLGTIAVVNGDPDALFEPSEYLPAVGDVVAEIERAESAWGELL